MARCNFDILSIRNIVFIAIQFPSGPDERGLAAQREITRRYSRAHPMWASLLIPKLRVVHPDIIRDIIRTSGETIDDMMRLGNQKRNRQQRTLVTVPLNAILASIFKV